MTRTKQHMQAEIEDLRAALGEAHDTLGAIYALEPLSDDGKKYVKEQGERLRLILESQ
jgi:hypothetical protein